MTAVSQNIAIAEAFDWKVVHGGQYVHPKGERWRSLIVDVTEDLNAQFEAWKRLTDEQKFAFRNWVQRIATRENIWAEEAQGRFGAECLLRALGKWKDS